MIFPSTHYKNGENLTLNGTVRKGKACRGVNQGRPAGGCLDKGCQATAKACSCVANPGLELEFTHFYLCHCILAVTGQI